MWIWFVKQVGICEREVTPSERIIPCWVADELEDIVEVVECC